MKVHERGSELGQVGTRYGCRWFGSYHETNKTVGLTNVYALTGNTGNCVGFIDWWMRGDCLGRRVNGTKAGCTNGDFLGLHRMIFKKSIDLLVGCYLK